MEMRIWLIYLWCTLVGHWSTTGGILSSALHNWAPVSVDRSLSVARGGQVDLSAAIVFHSEAVTSDCSVQYIATDSCGQVQPSRFSCSNLSGPILYQHSGCLSEREFARFQISSRTETSANVAMFSVEIVLEPVGSPIADITLELVHSNTVLGDRQAYDYRIVFPNELIGKCHYEIVTDWQPLSLPISGALNRVTNQPLPCGFMDNTSGLIYVPNNTSTPLPDEDYVLVKVHSHDKSIRHQFIVLPMKVRQSDNDSLSTVHVLPTQSLVIRQGANTLIPSSLLTFQNSSYLFHLNDSTHLYHYTFPVLNAGSFQSILSSSVNMSHSIFTNQDLLKGNVAFYPSFSAPQRTIFHYTISNVAGKIVAAGDVNVYVERHQWEWPVQRTNKPLEVLEGGSSIFDQRTLDFYLQTANLCMQQATMTPIILPKRGHLTFLNGSSVDGRSVLISAVKNGTALLYNHTSGDGHLADSIVWEVRCPSGPVLEVFTSVLIAPISDVPTVLLRGWDITVYRGWSTPLSPSSLVVSDFDSSFDDVTITSAGGLVILDLRDLDIDYPPYVRTDRILSQNITHNVTTFSLSDLDNYNVWYIPPVDTSVINQSLTFTIGESTATVGVEIVDRDLNETLYLSTHEEYPNTPHNIPLPLHTTAGTYITSAYLYSKVPPYPSEKVIYMVISPPGRGLLCLLSGEKCQTSISRFTQRDINSQHVYYVPDETDSLREDFFEFELTVDGFRQLSPVLHRFDMKPVKIGVSVNMTRLFYVNAGRSKAIAPRHFRPFTQHLTTRNVIFHITRGPHYGRLELNGKLNPSNFTFQDAFDRSLVYRHLLSAMEVYSDQFSFSVGNSTHSLDGTMTIAIRHEIEGDFHVQVSVKQHTLYLDHKKFVFSEEDINVTSSFGLDFVTFTLKSPPSFGVLNLFNNKHNTIIQLQENSTFTASDIYNGFLHYIFISPDPVSSPTDDMFNLTASDPDPESVWPPKAIDRSGPPVTGHFPIIIVPAPNVRHELAVDITSPGFLTWLPDYQQYGYVFSRQDIDVITNNSTVEPNQVVIQLDREPAFGSIWKGESMDNIFNIEDVNNGLVRYQSLVRPSGFFSDSFRMDVFINLMNPSFLARVEDVEFAINWATVSLQNSSLTVRENEGRAEVVIRRSGSLWLESQVLVSTVAESAEINTGGHRPPDFRNLTQRIIFPINVTEKTIVIMIDDDDIAEDTKTFSVVLSDPRDAVIDENQNRTKIWISDIDDYSMITAMGGISPTSECTYVTRVDEGARKANITLRRSGNLGERVGVVCYTVQQPRQATATEWSDYIPRRRDQSNSTVWFEVDQETAICEIEILDDLRAEFTERFFVKLDQETVGRAVVRDPSEVHCVEINNERSDWPVVNFTTSKLVVQESNTTDVLVPITILRIGPDLSVTTSLRLWPLLMDGDNAVGEQDFAFPQNESCPEGQALLSCGFFASGQSSIVLHVIIKHDSVLEPNESFHLKLDSQSKALEVVILDASPPAVVGFVYPVNHVQEATGFNSNNPEDAVLSDIPIVRSGYLNSSVTVFCRLKGAPNSGNATAGHDLGSTDTGMDFLTTLHPTEVTFQPGETNQSCQVLLYDDSVWEGPESLKVDLGIERGAAGSLGVEISEEASSTQVIIDDPEDVPTMEFRDPRTEALEPLSNFDIDKITVTLTLVRSGDLSYSTAVMYGISIYPPSQMFSAVNREAVFSPNEDQTNITIDLRANYESNDNQQITVTLIHGSERVLDAQNVPARIGDAAVAVIVITNRGYQGPFFPGLPTLENEGEPRDSQVLYFDQPLLCVTPCSRRYNGGNNSFGLDCASQNISQEDTIYSWETSEDGVNFATLNYSTPLTNTYSERLDTFYLERNVYVRCSAQAVTYGGVRGHTRTSAIVHLQNKKYSCDGSGRGNMELTSYPGFIGHDKDLLRLSVRVPHRPNAIPLLSSHPIVDTTNHDTNASSCSTLIPGGGWLNNEPFYSHLDREQCTWEFTKWLPVEDWIDRCGSVQSSNFDSTISYINITVYSAYEQYESSELVHKSTLSGQIMYSTSKSTPFLPPPLLTLSANDGGTDAYIYPVAVHERSDAVQVYFYSMLPLEASATDSTQLALLHTDDSVSNGSKQVWRLELDRTLPSTIPVEFQLPACEMECDPAANATLTFPLSLSKDDNRYRPVLRANVSLRHSPLVVSNYSEPFTLGDRVYVVFELDPALAIQNGFEFSVNEMNLCQATSVMQRECSNQYQIVTTTGVAGDTSDFDVRLTLDEHTAVFQFNTSTIAAERLSTQWYLDISYGISNGHEFVVNENAILEISFVDPSRHTTAATQNTESATAAPTNKQFLYLAVGVLAIALVVTTVGFTIIGLYVWSSKVGQRKFQSRLEAERSRRNSSRKNSLALNNKKKIEDEEQTLRRSQSTTGFPTREKLRRSHRKRSSPPTVRAQTGRNEPQTIATSDEGASARPAVTVSDEGASVQSSTVHTATATGSSVVRARSLPNLTILETRAIFKNEPQPRNLRFNTTVSKVDTERWHLNKWAQHHIKANKQLEVARTIHDLATQRRNYGANESKQNTEANKESHGELARYAVRSLAASAKTPEPEKGPRTQL